MKRIFTLFSLLAFLFIMPQGVSAQEWSYNFDDFTKVYGVSSKKKAVVLELNGVKWHMCGVAPSVPETNDFMIGTGSMKLYGAQNCDWSEPEEFTNFTLTEKRSIGKFSFKAAPNTLWAGNEINQVAWMVQFSVDGNVWTTIGDPFKTWSDTLLVERDINNPSAMVRIVRADYQTFDYTKGLEYANVLNIDDMAMTEFTGKEVAELHASESALDFGELEKGSEKEMTFKLTHNNLSAPVEMSVKGSDASAFTLKTAELSKNGTDDITILFKAFRKGDFSATFVAKSGSLTVNVDLKASAKGGEGVKFTGGTGTKEDPYQITCKEDLFELSDDVETGMNTYEGKYFKVLNDINMEYAEGFRSIGNNFDRDAESETCIRPFSGTFDGDNHKIYNIKGAWDNYGFVGLFGIIKNATIKNVKIASSNIYGDFAAAALVGTCMEDCIISNCHIADDVFVSNTKFYAAGICAGLLKSGEKGSIISDCTNRGSIHGNVGFSAGILSTNSQENSQILRCGNYGEIVDEQLHVAGIVAGTKTSITIIDCYNVGDIQKMAVEGAENALGAGILAEGSEITVDQNIVIKNCYNLGSFNIVGATMHPIYDKGMTSYNNVFIENCYFSTEINSFDFEDVINLPLADMKTQKFIDLLNNDRNPGVWMFKDGVNEGYPVPENADGIVAGVENVKTSEAAISLANGNLQVSNVKGGAEIVLFDVAGRMVNKMFADAEGNASVNTESLNGGAYIVTVEGRTFKFVK